VTTTRDQIIQATCALLENQGYHATGLNEIVKASGAPKGSIYYYFPDGKEGITAEAVLFAGRTVAQRIRTHLAQKTDPAEAIQAFVEQIAYFVEESGFQAGGPLTIVASETATTSPKLNLTCREAYALLREAFQSKLLEGGLSRERAASLAWMITSATEGGIILSRTYHTGDPLREVARELACLIRNCGEPN
jgi:TetR/AcrR family transcriptional regulator, lmrAB and yxaGH operons repressor